MIEFLKVILGFTLICAYVFVLSIIILIIIILLIDYKKQKQIKMKKRQIEITIETAKRWYNNRNLEMKQLALEGFPELEEKELPKSWKDLDQINGFWVTRFSTIESICQDAENIHQNVFATKEQAKASLALAQLSQLRKVYRKGWIPDWNNKLQEKYCINFSENEIYAVEYFNINRFLSFQDEKTRDLFLENFHKLIEQAKPLMQ